MEPDIEYAESRIRRGPDGKWAKGSISPNPRGRGKGTLNRTSREVKDMLREALTAVGGARYLQEQAQANPSAFLALVAKLIPSEVKAELALHAVPEVSVRSFVRTAANAPGQHVIDASEPPTLSDPPAPVVEIPLVAIADVIRQ